VHVIEAQSVPKTERVVDAFCSDAEVIYLHLRVYKRFDGGVRIFVFLGNLQGELVELFLGAVTAKQVG
jgi:hypothetical protein